jgi:NADH-quinone oxidoreductase subunit I
VSGRRLPGKGLVEGLAVTARTMAQPAVTQEYPDQRPELPPRSRGVIALFEENCTVCMLCARECPDWCIYIDSHKETVPPTTEGGRARTRNVLDRFAIDYALCMYCGICVDVCPFDALFWSPEFEYSTGEIDLLTHERDRLREWMWTVPAPPADVANSEPQKAADRAATRAGRREQTARNVPPTAAQAAEGDAASAPEGGPA